MLGRCGTSRALHAWREQAAAMQGVLMKALQELPLLDTVAKQLSCLEIWVLWLCRLGDAQELCFEGEAAAVALQAKIAPYTDAARPLLDILVSCFSLVRTFPPARHAWMVVGPLVQLSCGNDSVVQKALPVRSGQSAGAITRAF